MLSSLLRAFESIRIQKFSLVFNNFARVNLSRFFWLRCSIIKKIKIVSFSVKMIWCLYPFSFYFAVTSFSLKTYFSILLIFSKLQLLLLIFLKFDKVWLYLMTKGIGVDFSFFFASCFNGWIDCLLLFSNCPTLGKLPLVEQYVSSFYQPQYWNLTNKGLRSMEHFSSKMVDVLIGNVSSFTSLLVCDKWFHKA